MCEVKIQGLLELVAQVASRVGRIIVDIPGKDRVLSMLVWECEEEECMCVDMWILFISIKD